MSFGNPLGFLTLVGIPAVLLIHLLQVRSRLVRVTTLFLLEPRMFEREGGRKIERLRTSLLLWLQLLAVLAATWLLVEPRWLREDTTLRVVLVVDGSASMSAYRDASEETLARYLPELERSAERVEWIVLGSDPTAPTLYTGEEREAAAAAASGWRSYLGVHEIDASLSLASSLAGPRGLVVLLTDHVPDVARGVELLAVGTPVDNVGLVSVSIEDDGRWRAIVKSSASSTQKRSWWVEADGVPSAPMSLDIEPGQVRFVSGEFLANVEQMELVLDDDRFALDDRLPFLRPQSKTLLVHVASELEDNSFVRGFSKRSSLSSSHSGERGRCLGKTGPMASILFAEPASGYLDGPIVVENDDLVEGTGFPRAHCWKRRGRTCALQTIGCSYGRESDRFSCSGRLPRPGCFSSGSLSRNRTPTRFRLLCSRFIDLPRPSARTNAPTLRTTSRPDSFSMSLLTCGSERRKNQVFRDTP